MSWDTVHNLHEQEHKQQSYQVFFASLQLYNNLQKK